MSQAAHKDDGDGWRAPRIGRLDPSHCRLFGHGSIPICISQVHKVDTMVAFKNSDDL